MAFKILNDEEVALLTDEQRKNYENELDIYQQRAAFIERIEELEKVEVKPYEPKLEAIQVMNEVEVKNFENPEYSVSVCEPVKKPEVKTVIFEKTEQAPPVLPRMETKPKVSVEHVKEIDSVKAEVPAVRKIVMEEKQFHEPKIQQPVLENVARPGVKIKQVETIKGIQPKLPEAVKADVKIKTFETFEKVQPKLPEAAKANVDVKSFEMPEKVQPGLQKVETPAVHIKKFNPIETQNIDLPTIVKPDVCVDLYNPTAIDEPILPKISGPGVDNIKVFDEPELVSAQLPDTVEVNVPVYRFSKEITHVEPKLPEVKKADVKEREFSGLRYSDSGLPNVTKPSVHIAPFEMNMDGHPELPARTVLKIPDVSATLKELLSVTGEATGILEG